MQNQKPSSIIKKRENESYMQSETKCSICKVEVYKGGKYLNDNFLCADCQEEQTEIFQKKDFKYDQLLLKDDTQTFAIPEKFQRFLISQPGDILSLKCDQCEFLCEPVVKQFEEHYLTHYEQGINESECFIKDFGHSQTNEDNLQCDICLKAFLKKVNLISHVKTHSKKIFMCKICSCTFKSKMQLKTHKKRHVGKPVNSTLIFCEICKKYFKTKKGFAYHQQNICVQYKCYVCDETFLVHSVLQDHMKKNHDVKRKPVDDPTVKANDNETIMSVCPICGKVVTHAVLPRHMVLHNEERPFTCDLCGKQFKRKHSLQDHIMIEMGMKNYVCDICGMKFLKQGYLNKHVRYHKLNNGEFQGFPCEVCGKKFPEKWRLGVHQRAVHKGGKFSSCKCDICGTLFAERWMVKLHKAELHNGEEFKEYQCDICGKKFLEKWLMKSHERTTHRSGVKKMYCYLCGRTDHMSKDCVHRQALQEVQCELCEKTFSSEYFLKEHFLKEHEHAAIAKTVVIKKEKKLGEDNLKIECDPLKLTKSVLYMCAGCGMQFINKKQWKEHEMIDNCYKHTKYDCAECGKSYTSKSSLSNHAELHKKAAGSLPYHCNSCGKEFATEEALKSHSPPDMFCCLLCGKVYPCKDQLKNHVFSEHNDNDNDNDNMIISGCSRGEKTDNGPNGDSEEKPFECKLCSKKFTRKQAMKNHLFAEMNLRRYVCEFCDKSYNYYSHLKEHIVTNHGEKEYLCGYCGKNFPTKKRFRDHVTLHSEEKPFLCQCGQSFKLSRYLSKHKKHCKFPEEKAIDEDNEFFQNK